MVKNRKFVNSRSPASFSALSLDSVYNLVLVLLLSLFCSAIADLQVFLNLKLALCSLHLMIDYALTVRLKADYYSTLLIH